MTPTPYALVAEPTSAPFDDHCPRGCCTSGSSSSVSRSTTPPPAAGSPRRSPTYDTLQLIGAPVATTCVGQAASAARVLLAAGTRAGARS